MLEDQEEVLKKANGLDLSLVKIEILASPTIPKEFKKKAEPLLEEYRRFLAIKVIFGDTKLPPRFSPSAIINQVWHCHLLLSRHYLNCCKELGVHIIDHDPASSRDSLESRREGLESYKTSYKFVFQIIPPEFCWPSPSTSSPATSSEEISIHSNAVEFMLQYIYK